MVETFGVYSGGHISFGQPGIPRIRQYSNKWFLSALTGGLGFVLLAGREEKVYYFPYQV